MFLFILMVFIFLLLLQGYLFYFERGALKKLEIKMEPIFQRCEIDEEIMVKVTCTNAKGMILPIVHITLVIPESFDFEEKNESFFHQRTIKATFTLFSYQRRSLYFKLKPSQRGYYDMRLQIACVDLLGLKHVSLQHDVMSSIVVHPKMMSLEENLFNMSLSGQQVVRRFIHPDPLFFNGVRPYQSFDAQKDIDWKATAKTQQLQVKQYEYTSEPSVALYLAIPALTKWAQEEEDFIETAVSWSASFIQEAFVKQADFSFDTNGYGKIYYDQQVAFSSSYMKYCAYLDEISCVNQQTPLSMPCFLEEITFPFRETQYFVLTRCDDDIPDDWIMYWLAKGVHLTLVVFSQSASFKPCPHLFLRGGIHP